MLKMILKTKKEVVVREMDLSDQRAAAKNIGATVNEAEMQIAMQQELVKLLLVSIDGKKLKGLEKENLKELLTWGEYNQILMVVKDMLGNDEMPKVEMITDHASA